MTTLPELLLVRATDAPDGFAYDAGGSRLTWRTLRDGALRAAAVLSDTGVSRGTPVAIVLTSSAEFLHAFFGAQLIGAVPVAMSRTLMSSQLRRRVAEFGCGAVVADPAAVTSSDDGREPWPAPIVDPRSFAGRNPLALTQLRMPELDDISHLQVTSGTTGEPRAAMLLHRNVLASVESARDTLDPCPADIFVGWVPLHHDLGLVRFVLGPLYYACPAYLILPAVGTIAAWIETMAATRATITAAPDFAYRLATRLAPPTALPSLRIATNGGEPVRASTIHAFETHCSCPGAMRPGYGLAETTLGVATLGAGDPRHVDATGAVSCGRPYRGLAVRIMDDGHAPCPSGTTGRIFVKGAAVFAGYWNDPAMTASVLRDGWLDTGDDGALDDNGYLYVRGRRRAMIKRAGAAIAPREIEEVVDEVPGIRRSAAFGMTPTPSHVTEEVVVAAEVDRSIDAQRRQAIAQEIAARVREAIGAVPHEIRLVAPNTIPRTPSGKIRYDELKRIAATRGSA